MIKIKKHNKLSARTQNPNHHDCQEGGNCFQVSQENKHNQTITIPLDEYRTLMETASTVKLFKKCIKNAIYSSEIDAYARVIFGDEKEEGNQNDG